MLSLEPAAVPVFFFFSLFSFLSHCDQFDSDKAAIFRVELLTSVGGGRVHGGDITQLVQPSVLHHKRSSVSHVKALHGTAVCANVHQSERVYRTFTANNKSN